MVNDKMCITTKNDRIMLRIDPIINDEITPGKKMRAGNNEGPNA